MSKWTIIPFSRFGILKFGMLRSSIRDQLGDDFQSFRKSPTSINETDAYDRLGIHLYFDPADRLNFVEAVANDCGDIEYSDVSFFRQPLDSVIAEITGKGVAVARESDGCYFPELGIAFFAPDKMNLESVGVFAAERFSEYLRLRSEIAEKRRQRRERNARKN